MLKGELREIFLKEVLNLQKKKIKAGSTPIIIKYSGLHLMDIIIIEKKAIHFEAFNDSNFSDPHQHLTFQINICFRKGVYFCNTCKRNDCEQLSP